MKTIQAIRGFNDIIEDIDLWQQVEDLLERIARQHAYQEIRTPYCEASGLFERSIGITSDIVHKEMYTFSDKNEQTISLRPEGTASVVRACIENSLLYDQARKFYYLGSMFRRERPQRGRLRQFNQFGMESLGYTEPYADVELLCVVHKIFKELGIRDEVSLELNYLGSQNTRQRYGQALKDFYKPFKQEMSELNQKRLTENTLRLLDSKEEYLVKINEMAPTISDYYTQAEHLTFAEIQRLCRHLEIPFTVNCRLMRGLDYYTGLIYEWKTDKLGAQSTVCGGGRYDLLFESLGHKAEPACGFSIGLERLLELYKETSTLKKSSIVGIAALDQGSLLYTMEIAEKLREDCPRIRLYSHYEQGKVGSLIKKALKKSVDILLLCGETEKNSNTVTIKYLQNQDQDRVVYEDLVNELRKHYD